MKDKIFKLFILVSILAIMSYLIGIMPLASGGSESLYPLWIPISFNILQMILIIALVIASFGGDIKKLLKN